MVGLKVRNYIQALYPCPRYPRLGFFGLKGTWLGLPTYKEQQVALAMRFRGVVGITPSCIIQDTGSTLVRGISFYILFMNIF